MRVVSCSTLVSPMSSARWVVAVGDGPPALQDVVRLGAVAVVDGPHAHQLLVERVVVGGRRIVAQLGVLDHHVADVDPEARDAAVPPEPHDVVEGAAHVLAPPVQVGLLRARSCAGSTGRSASSSSQAEPPKTLTQLFGGPPSGVGSAQTYQSRCAALAARAGVDEPRVLVAGVVGHQVEQDPDAAAAAPRRPGCRDRPGCRSRDRCRSSRPRRSPSRGWATP